MNTHEHYTYPSVSGRAKASKCTLYVPQCKWKSESIQAQKSASVKVCKCNDASAMMSMQVCNEHASVSMEWKTSTGDVQMKNISPLYKFSLKGGGWDEQRQPKMQPSAEIVRVECAKCRRECDWCGPRATLCGDRACRVTKCRRECDLPAARATLCGDRACRVREMQARVRLVRSARNPLRRSCVSSARNAGESAICPVPAQPSAEIVRVECAKCRRECDLSGARATLCADRACRVREIQARVRFAGCPRNPLRRSCVSSARNAGESASESVRAQPSAEIGRVGREMQATL